MVRRHEAQAHLQRRYRRKTSYNQENLSNRYRLPPVSRKATLVRPLFAAVDVHYSAGDVAVGVVVFRGWNASAPTEVLRWVGSGAQPYIPGEFYRRELPFIEQALRAAASYPEVSVVIVDGYVELDHGRAGLGRHLYEALGGSAAVVGVAKTPFGDASWARPVRRGRSHRPLLVTAAGMSLDDASEGVRSMSGPNRLPALLKLADRMARGRARN